MTLTWAAPHAFAQQPTMAVDYRVMLSFLELYEVKLLLSYSEATSKLLLITA